MQSHAVTAGENILMHLQFEWSYLLLNSTLNIGIELCQKDGGASVLFLVKLVILPQDLMADGEELK